ncbi:26S proteasome regulatory subunit Rpn2 [Purpureocillium lavendulum]|uniref:26S proteasome regulatory subunit Rpn2 n=1 Tax=Purpureocillium lavendulum TaxID=1247861 RepID=A0AB34FFM1_9HYPO|nr:26S proteasome regulatory subunit Rpn2 [Purpureocillium lavendulum]
MTDPSIATERPLLAIAQAPSFCRLCNVELRGHQTWRAHLKSDGHVYKLRLKVAEPGSDPSPPSPRSSNGLDQSTAEKAATPSRARRSQHLDMDSDQDDEVESETDDEPSAPEFAPGRCLFCAQESGTLEDSMRHMSSAHAFAVPFRDFLAVDLETIVWYLHFIIYGYRECICCGTRRSTVEGVQQHMGAKGHCRFDISPDTEEFYEMPQTENVIFEQAQRDDSVPVRLASGKLVSHRRNSETQEPRAARQTRPDPERESRTLRFKDHPQTPGQEVATRQETHGSGEVVRSSEALLAAQLSRLRIAGDRAQHKMEEKKRGRVERRNNLTFSKHFRVDAGDGRVGRKFCC